MVAHREGLPSADIAHARVGLKRDALRRHLGGGGVDRGSSVGLLSSLLKGRASPFRGSLGAGRVSFVLDCCHPWPSLYDAVVLFAHHADRGAIAGALRRLRRAGVLRA